MNDIKQFPKVLSLLCMLAVSASLVSNVWAQQPQSDYEIQKEFKNQLKSYHRQLEEADSTQPVDSLIEEIKDFEQSYRVHSDLLNKALYPETFQEKMDQLKKTSLFTRERLETIERQNQRLAKLENQLTDYESDLDRLDKNSDSLRQAMQQSIQSEKKLSDMVRRYRESLEKRDDLVLAFIDSMVVAYEQMDLESVQDLENMHKKSRIGSNGNALEMIQNITEENIKILENNSAKLRFEDYMRMSEVQVSFEKMWDRLGPKIVSVYSSGNDSEVKRGEIDKNLAEWRNMLNNQTFAALHDSLKKRSIDVKGFNSPEGLFSAITNFLDDQIAASREGATNVSYERFSRFQDFWNRVGLPWASTLKNADLLSGEQMAVINQKVDRWGQNARPQSNLLVYLLGASILAIVALSIFLAKEKQRK